MFRWFRKKAPARPRPPVARLHMEQLEDRRLLAVTYHGGPILPHVEVEAAFYGQYWETPAGQQEEAQINTYLSFLTGSSYMDLLNEYGVGRGSLTDAGVTEPTAGGPTISDNTIRQLLQADIAQGSLQAPDGERLYIVFTGPNVDVTDGRQDSVHDFLGYHDSFVDAAGQNIYYAVIANPAGNGDIPGLNDFQTLTSVTSHELSEGATDPDGTAWYDDRTGDEIGDLAQNLQGVLNVYVVQGEWSARLNEPVLPPGALALPPSGRLPLATALDYVGYQFTTSYEYDWNTVAYDYTRYLGRSGSAAEISSWVAWMQQGATAEQVLAGFLASQEYYQNAGGTDPAWIQRLYQDLLGRSADSGGEQTWLTALAATGNRAAVAYAIVTSDEHEQLVILSDYEQFLGRVPTAAEIAGWLTPYHQGATNAQIAAAFLASPEFYQDQGGTIAGWLTSVYQKVLDRAPDPAGYNTWDQFLNTIT